MSSKKQEKIPQEAIRQIKPDIVAKDPPDVAPKNSILQHAAPTLDDVDALTGGDLENMLDIVDIDTVEKRITLLSRLVIEKMLWNKSITINGVQINALTAKERADLAIKAIQTLEGTKKTLWVKDEDDEYRNKSKEQIEKEIDASKGRLAKILNEDKKIGEKERTQVLSKVRARVGDKGGES